MEYIIREDNLGKIMFNTEEYKLPTLEYILYTNYKYIYEDLTENNPFRVGGVVPAVFKEIVFENKVVGFSSYDAGMGVMCLKYIYVLPEFRGNNLLIKDLLDTKSLFENQGYNHVAIDMPNYFVIESLLKNGLAVECGKNNHLVISDIPLTFSVKDAKDVTDEESEWLKEKFDFDVGDTSKMKSLQAVTQLYDKEICACVSLDFNLITAMCDEDIRKIPNLMEKRRISDDEYWSNLFNELQSLIDDGVIAIR